MDEAGRTPLGARQAAILLAVVREYIRTGEPVGSKELVRRYRLEVSPATVRNEMARLEEMTLLAQPHTSAGRVPTDRGYRLFVDAIEPPLRLRRDDQRVVREELAGEPESMEALLGRATEVISRITHQAAAVAPPALASSRLRHIDLVPIGTRTVLVVLVAESGRVEQRIARVDHDVSPAELDRMASDLNHSYAGERLVDAQRRLVAAAKSAQPDERSVPEGVADAMDEAFAGEGRLFVSGASHLAEEESFERDTLRRVYEALERHTSLLELLARELESGTRDESPAPVTVRIGPEVGDPDFRGCSIVVAQYGVGEGTGTVGVIGPMRMDYHRAMAAAEAVARSLEGTLGHAPD